MRWRSTTACRDERSGSSAAKQRCERCKTIITSYCRDVRTLAHPTHTCSRSAGFDDSSSCPQPLSEQQPTSKTRDNWTYGCMTIAVADGSNYSIRSSSFQVESVLSFINVLAYVIVERRQAVAAHPRRQWHARRLVCVDSTATVEIHWDERRRGWSSVRTEQLLSCIAYRCSCFNSGAGPSSSDNSTNDRIFFKELNAFWPTQ